MWEDLKPKKLVKEIHEKFLPKSCDRRLFTKKKPTYEEKQLLNDEKLW